MQRLLPETPLEMKMLCLGAIFIEENFVLDELYEVVMTDLVDNMDIHADESRLVLNELSQTFFRLDMNYGPEVKGDCLGILQEFWGVRDTSSAQQSLNNILTQGHRTKFNVLAATLGREVALSASQLQRFQQIFEFDFDERTPAQMSDEDYIKLGQWMIKSKSYLKESGILAWDAARYIHLIRLCFISGYLDSDTAWKGIVKLAPFVEGHFSNWMEFSQSFLIGRTFWSGQDDPQVKSICERLLSHPVSPWQFFPW